MSRSTRLYCNVFMISKLQRTNLKDTRVTGQAVILGLALPALPIYYYLYIRNPVYVAMHCVSQSLNSVLSYLSSVSQHWIFGFGQLLSADDLQHQLLLHLTRHRVLQVGVKGTCRRENKNNNNKTNMTLLSKQREGLELIPGLWDNNGYSWINVTENKILFYLFDIIKWKL